MMAKAEYEKRVALAHENLKKADARSARIANLRTVAFLGAAALLFLVIFERLPRAGLLGALALFVGYLALAVAHGGVLRLEERTRVGLELNERGLRRLAGAWHDFPHTGARHLPEGHLYASDLDVLGKGSLFQRLDETGTKQGEAQLVDWLLAPAPSADEIRARQVCVRELGPQVDFRQTLITEARLAGKDKADPSRFVAWAETPSALATIRWAYRLAHVLPPGTVVAGLLSANDLLSSVPFWVGLLAQIAIVVATRKPISALWQAVALSERGFVRFDETFQAIDAQAFVAPKLATLQRGLQDGPPVSARLKQFARLLGFAELKNSGQLHPLINALLLWDIHVLFRVDAWREEHGRGVRRWFEALAQLEGLASFAAWHFERPDDVFPEVTDGEVRLTAVALGHPLLGAPVCNDLTLPGPGSALVITGSNMSGKTTLMRATGLNVVMALAGLPVAARAFKVSWVQVMTSMRVKDSLERGVSYFYAEVQRIKLLLDTAKTNPARCLFLLDELFMGTNTRERQIASRQLMLMLLDAGAAGAVTTHDLSLCELATERPAQVRNVHFRDEVKGDEMHFDYTLRDGVVQTTNALEVLRRAGVPVQA
jgi:ABC-type multidrug transport system fused ATPase/permease subunit